MSLTNPNIQPFDDTDNRTVNSLLQNQRQVVEQKTKILNENLSTPCQLTVSSSSSNASSTSSPPAFSQTSSNSTSTPSSLASSSSPQQNSNQATPTHPQLTLDRFRIKKTLQNDIIINPSLASTPANEELKTLKEDQFGENLSLDEINENKLEPQVDFLNSEQTVKNNERRISKFIVKKVDSTDLLIAGKNENENKKEDAKFKIEDSFLVQSKQIDKFNEQQSSEPRANSLVEKSNDSETLSKETEEEKTIDESPDKRFLKYDTEIGHGSFKTVYKGLDTESGVPIAWCELHDRKFNKAERLRFIEEAQMLKQLQHPNIVRFYEYWEDAKAKPKKIILVTELMTSGTLKAYVQRFSSTRLKVIKNFSIQILKGLAYLHSRSPPVIHRDLKCDNIFVTGQSGQVKIGDLGLATLKKASFAKSVIGTPEFMAPEMYSEQYDERIDVYAFGMCLLEMATGEYPYQECSKPFEIYKRVTSGVKPDNYNKIDNEDLKELIDLCIRLKSSERPQVKELLNHSWFMESNGLKLEILKDKNQQIIQKADGTITFRLKVNDKTKRKPNWPAWPDNEEIEFSFDVNNDDPEQIVKELKEKTNKICDDDLKFLTQAIKDKVCVFRFQTDDKNEEETLTQSQTIINESAVLQQSMTKIENVAEKNQILNENQKMLNESLALVNTTIDQSLSLIQSSSENQTQNQQQIISNNSTSTLAQQPQAQSQPVKHVQFCDQINKSDESSKEKDDKEIPFVLTIKELSETAETGEVAHCILELDNKEEIMFKFGLNADAPQQITNQLLSVSKDILSIDYGESLNETIQKIIEYIVSNKHNFNSIKSKKFTSCLQSSKNKKTETAENKSTTNENLINQQNLNSNNIQALQQSLNQVQPSTQLHQQQVPIQTVQQQNQVQTQQLAIIQTPNNSLSLLKQQNILNLNYQNAQQNQPTTAQQLINTTISTKTSQAQQPMQQQQIQQPLQQPIQKSMPQQAQQTPILQSQQLNQYLDPSKYLVQNQYQVSMEIQNLLNSVENIPQTNASSLQLTGHHQQTHSSLLQQNLGNQISFYPHNQAYAQNQMHIQNLSNLPNQNEFVDLSLKHPNPTIHQSLLQNALLSQFLNQHPLIIPKQQQQGPQSQQHQQQQQQNANSFQRTTRIVNNLPQLNMQQPIQPSIGPMSAPILTQGSSSKTTSPSNNSTSISNQIAASQIHQMMHQKIEQNDFVNQSDIEQKPLYSSVVAHNTNNVVTLNENIGQNIQNLIKTQAHQHQQQQQINSSSNRKQSYIPDTIINQTGGHLNETTNDQDLSISNLNLDDLKSAHIQNVLNQKLENPQNNDILGQLGERIKYLLSEKVLENQNQLNELQTNAHNQANYANPIHHNPHQQHLNDSMGTYSPSLSRRNSVDLKEKQLNSVKQQQQQLEQTKAQQINYGLDQVDGPTNIEPHQQMNENNLAQLILSLVNSNQLSLQQQHHQQQQQSQQVQAQPLYQHQNSYNQQNQLITTQQQQPLNPTQIQSQVSNQQVQHQQFLNQPTKQLQQAQQLNNLNEGYNFIENQNRNLASLQASLLLNTINRTNLEELFSRQRKEIEELLKRHQLELQEYVLDSSKQTLTSHQ